MKPVLLKLEALKNIVTGKLANVQSQHDTKVSFFRLPLFSHHGVPWNIWHLMLIFKLCNIRKGNKEATEQKRKTQFWRTEVDQEVAEIQISPDIRKLAEKLYRHLTDAQFQKDHSEKWSVYSQTRTEAEIKTELREYVKQIKIARRRAEGSLYWTSVVWSNLIINFILFSLFYLQRKRQNRPTPESEIISSVVPLPIDANVFEQFVAANIAPVPPEPQAENVAVIQMVKRTQCIQITSVPLFPCAEVHAIQIPNSEHDLRSPCRSTFYQGRFPPWTKQMSKRTVKKRLTFILFICNFSQVIV